MKIKISREDLRSKDLFKIHKDCFSYSKDEGCLVLKNIEIDFEPDTIIPQGLRELVIDNCAFLKKVSIQIEKVSIIRCVGYETIEFSRGTTFAEIVDSDFGQGSLVFLAGVISIKFSNVKCNYFRTLSEFDKEQNDYQYYLQQLIIERKTTLSNVRGFHNLLRPNSYTVTEFSLDSDIEKDAESNYRILRANAKKMADGVQSDILYSKILALHAKKTDRDGKILLFFENWTNSYGQNFLLPLMWMILFNGVFIMFFQYSGVLPYSGFWNFIANTINVNPLHQLIDSSKSEMSSTIAGFDSVRRLILAVLAYQVVSSARRFSHNKK